ncbi:MAG: hypothetical protein WBV98_26535, partial [Candidatus Sulfotelmatobacter sp.]
MPVHSRQHGPDLTLVGGAANGTFQNLSHLRMLFRGRDSFEVTEGTEYRFVRAQLVIGLPAERIAYV